MIKLVLLATFVAAASAAFPFAPILRKPTSVYTPSFVPKPQTYGSSVFIPIVRSVSDISPDGNHYSYAYETGNGISANEQGDLVGSGPDAAIAAQGGFQYTSPEGVPVQIQYLADANGFQPAGNVLPTPPPTPEAILRSLQYNAAHPESPSVYPIKKYY